MRYPAGLRINAGSKKATRALHSLCLFIMPLVFIASAPLYARGLPAIETSEVIVYFDGPLASSAQKVAHVYPAVRSELEATLERRVDFRPTVLLVQDRDAFARMAGSSLFVAYALPEKMLIVIDNSRMSAEPLTLSTTLKHELCHLLLHRWVSQTPLPRWLDEGICQWASGGFAELISGRGKSALAWAALGGGFIALDALTTGFPEDEHGLALSYEESRSVVEYITGIYGKNGILTIVQALQNGRGIHDAISMSLGISLQEMEKRWQVSQRSWTTLISYLVANLYTILFVFAAALTIVAYIRALIRKRRFKDEEDPDAP